MRCAQAQTTAEPPLDTARISVQISITNSARRARLWPVFTDFLLDSIRAEESVTDFPNLRIASEIPGKNRLSSVQGCLFWTAMTPAAAKVDQIAFWSISRTNKLTSLDNAPSSIYERFEFGVQSDKGE